MKWWIFFLIACVNSLLAVELPLIDWDQGKLAELLLKLPFEAKSASSIPIEGNVAGVRVKNKFPKQSDKWAVECVSDFYLDAAAPSRSTCSLSLDESNSKVSLKNDEYLILLDNVEIAKILFDAISYGKPLKEFRSSAMKWGTNHDGKKSYVFDYYFRCSDSSCVLRFANLDSRLRPDRNRRDHKRSGTDRSSK